MYEFFFDETLAGIHGEAKMATRRASESVPKATASANQSKGRASTPYGYAWTDWLAQEDPKWATARLSVSAMVGLPQGLRVRADGGDRYLVLPRPA